MSNDRAIPVVSNIPSAEEDLTPSNIATIFNPLTCIKRGHCDVGSDALRLVKSHRLYYELHGSRDPTAEKVLLIMGLNNSCFAWHQTLEYLTTKGHYQVLCFDNRGVGHSEHSNDGRFYKTSQMAADVDELLHFVGWTEKRSLNVVGISMGGMISLELALLIPDRVNSMILTSTKSGNTRQWPSIRGAYFFTKLMLLAPIKSNAFAVDQLASVLFPDDYLNAQNATGKGGTNRDAIVADFLLRVEIGNRQSLAGRLGQLAAVATHQVSPAKLALIAASIPKIAIIHGTEDSLIHYSSGRELHENLKGSEFVLMPGKGHAIPKQWEGYGDWLIKCIAEGRGRQRLSN